MGCKIVKTKDGAAIQCGTFDKVLPEDSKFVQDNDPPFINVVMNKMNINSAFKEKFSLKDVDKVAEGWPGVRFYIEIFRMMGAATYERVKINPFKGYHWKLLKTERGIV